MGRSDPVIFKKYLECLGVIELADKYADLRGAWHRHERWETFINDGWQYTIGKNFFGDVAFLGWSKQDLFTTNIICNSATYYDLMLGNWNINDDDWHIEDEKFDAVFCTRTPYFAKDPQSFIEKCYKILKPGGRILVDWGLGDHWRCENYKIGWVKGAEHESCYEDDNFLWSAVWDDSFLKNKDYEIFEEYVKKFRYNDVKKSVFEEVPSILQLSSIKKLFNVNCELMALWPESPQLYIIIYGTKK